MKSSSTEKDENVLLEEVKNHNLPRHIAIIMDGNGRWAKKQGFKSRISGHRAGRESVRRITRECGELGIEYLTLFAFSKENWRRPRTEVAALMELLESSLIKERPELMENNVRLRAIGALDDLPARFRKTLEESIALTFGNTGLQLILALSYGGRTEIIEAARKIATGYKNGTIPRLSSINEKLFLKHLYAPDVPEPDLLIRTSGELRVSNFLLWQIAYAEIYVTEVLWPDFKRLHLLQAIKEYQNRERRFGKIKPD